MSIDVGAIQGSIQFDLTTQALTDAVAKLAEVAAALTRTGDRAKESGTATEAAYRKLAASLDPVVAAQQKMERAQQTLDAALAKGLISQDQYTQALARAEEKFSSTEQRSTSLREKLDELAHSVQGFGEHLNELGEKFESVKEFGEGLKEKILELAAIIGVGLSLDKIIEDTVASQDAQAQLAAGLKAVGAATGETREKLESLTNTLVSTTKYSRTTIEQAESLGLTFTHISADAFPRFLKAAADISARTGEDLPAAVEKLGRALDTGMVQSLKRAGITFDQTATAQAKFFAETGQYSKEIALVLGQVESKLSGSAEAARNTLGGALQLLRNEFEEVAISIGTHITPALVALTKQIEELSKSDQFKQLAADLGTLLVSSIKVLGEALEFLATHLEAVKEVGTAILLIKLAAWLKEVAEAEIIAGIATIDLGAAFEAIQVLGLAGGLQYLKLVIVDATTALRAFIAEAAAAAAPFAAIVLVVGAAAFVIRQYTLEQQAASQEMQRQLGILAQSHTALTEAKEATAAVTEWQRELDKARDAGDPEKIAAAERQLAEAHKLVTQELKNRVQAAGSALVAELALAEADLKHAQELAAPTDVRALSGASSRSDFLPNTTTAQVQEAKTRVTELQQKIKQLGDEYIALSKIPVVDEGQKNDVAHFAEHFDAAAQAVQAYADKIFDLTNKLVAQGANQSKLLSALGESEIAYNLQKAAIERDNAIEQTATEIKKVHREELEKLRAEVDKARAALSEKHGVDQAATAAIREGTAALAEADNHYQTALASLTALAAKNVDWAQAEKQRLFILQDNRAAQDAYDGALAQYQDLVARSTAATQAHATQLNVERTLLAASRLGIEDLDGSIEKNVRTRDAQTNSLRAQIDVQRQINAIDDHTLNIKAQIDDWYAERDAVAKYGAEVAGILKQYGLLSAATQERAADEAYLRELEKGADFEQAKRLYDAIKGQQAITNGLREVQAATVIAEQHYKEFADALAQNFAGVFANFIKDGKISLADFETATIDAFASVEQKIITDWLSQWFEAMAQWLVRWIATMAAAKAAQSGLGDSSGSGGNSGSSWLSLLSTAYKAYAGYAGGGGAGVNGASAFGGGYGANAAGDFGGGYGSGFSSAGSGAGAAAGWLTVFAAIAAIGLNLVASHHARVGEDTFGASNGQFTYANSGKNESTDAHNQGQVNSAAQQVIDQLNKFVFDIQAYVVSQGDVILKKKGQGGSTDWRVYANGIVTSFGKDVNAAMDYAALQELKSAKLAGISPELATAIKNSLAKTVDGIQNDIQGALAAVHDRLGASGSQVYDTVNKYQQEIAAEKALGLAIDATVAARNREIAATKNQLLGIDTSLADNIAAILSFNRGIDEATKNLSAATDQILGMTVDEAQKYLAQYGSLLDQYKQKLTERPDPKNGIPGVSQWVDALGNVADDATTAILNKLGPLKSALDEYAKELGELPEKITKDQLAGTIFNGLLKYVKDASAYEEQREKYAKAMVEIQFALLKIQIEAAGLWEDLATLFTDAYNQAIKDATTPPAASTPTRSSGGSGGQTPAQQLADFFAAFDRSQLPALTGAIADINKKYDDEIKAVHATGETLAKLNADRQIEIAQAKEQARQSAVGNAQQFINSTLPALVTQINGVHTSAQGLIDGLRSVAAQGGLSTAELHKLVEAIRDAEKAQVVAIKTGVLDSINQFAGALDNAGLTGQLANIASQAQKLRDSLNQLAQAGALTADEFFAAAGKLQDAAKAQQQAAYETSATTLLDQLYGYLHEDAKQAQLKFDLTVASLKVQEAQLEAAVKAYGLVGDYIPEIKALIDRVQAAGPSIFASGGGTGTGPNPANVFADAAAQQASAASTLQQAADAFAQSTQKLIDYQKSLLTNPSVSPLTPSQQRDEALAQVQADYASALGGNIDARNAFSGLADTFLKISRSVNPSDLGYGADFQLIQDMLTRLIGANTYTVPGTINVTAGAFGGSASGGYGTGAGTGTGTAAGNGSSSAIDLSPIVLSVQAGSNRNHQDLSDLTVEVRQLRLTVTEQQGKLARIANYLDRAA